MYCKACMGRQANSCHSFPFRQRYYNNSSTPSGYYYGPYSSFAGLQRTTTPGFNPSPPVCFACGQPYSENPDQYQVLLALETSMHALLLSFQTLRCSASNLHTFNTPYDHVQSCCAARQQASACINWIEAALTCYTSDRRNPLYPNPNPFGINDQRSHHFPSSSNPNTTGFYGRPRPTSSRWEWRPVFSSSSDSNSNNNNRVSPPQLAVPSMAMDRLPCEVKMINNLSLPNNSSGSSRFLLDDYTQTDAENPANNASSSTTNPTPLAFLLPSLVTYTMTDDGCTVERESLSGNPRPLPNPSSLHSSLSSLPTSVRVTRAWGDEDLVSTALQLPPIPTVNMLRSDQQKQSNPNSANGINRSEITEEDTSADPLESHENIYCILQETTTNEEEEDKDKEEEEEEEEGNKLCLDMEKKAAIVDQESKREEEAIDKVILTPKSPFKNKKMHLKKHLKKKKKKQLQKMKNTSIVNLTQSSSDKPSSSPSSSPADHEYMLDCSSSTEEGSIATTYGTITWSSEDDEEEVTSKVRDIVEINDGDFEFEADSEDYLLPGSSYS